MLQICEAPKLGQAVNSISVVDVIKQVYEKGLFSRLNCLGRQNACDIDIHGTDKDRLIGYFSKRKEFNKEEHNESGVFSVEFISDKYDIEIFDSFVRIYKIPQNEAKKISIKDLQKLLNEGFTGDPDSPDEDKIEAKVDRLYKRHQNNKFFKQAYNRCMDSNDLDESVKSSIKESDDIEVEPMKGPKDTKIGALATMINQAIKDEWSAIQTYNDLSLKAREYGYEDIAVISDEIGTEENKHVGQLQMALAEISPNTDAIRVGEQEGEEQLDESWQDDYSDEELANIYGGDIEYDNEPDGVEMNTPDDVTVQHITQQVINNKRNVVNIDYDDYVIMLDNANLVDLPDLTADMSQGTGNVMVYFVYNKDNDTVYRYVSY